MFERFVERRAEQAYCDMPVILILEPAVWKAGIADNNQYVIDAAARKASSSSTSVKTTLCKIHIISPLKDARWEQYSRCSQCSDCMDQNENLMTR